MSKPRLVAICDSAPWAQCIFARDLARLAESFGWDAMVAAGAVVPDVSGALLYSPTKGAIEHGYLANAKRRSTGLWSHCSYGGWFTDDPLDDASFSRHPTHCVNLYQYHILKGRYPYLPGGVDTDLFRPAADEEREGPGPGSRDHRMVVGWTGSEEFNAALKVFYDRVVPAVRLAGCDGPLASARIKWRPLMVGDCRDARPPALVADMLRGVDVMVWASVSEGCSLSVLEAAASGCAIVSTPVGNAAELVMDPRLLVSWTPSDIARALRLLESDRDLLRDIQRRTRAVVEQYWSWKSPIKRDAWKAWLTGEGRIPSPAEQVPYVQAQGPEVLEVSRRLREESVPRLVRGDMWGA